MSGAFFFENIVVIKNESGTSNNESKSSKSSCAILWLWIGLFFLGYLNVLQIVLNILWLSKFLYPTDEEIERETTNYLKELELLYGKKKVDSVDTASSNDDGLAKSEEEIRATMRQLEIEKKIENRRLKKIEREKEPQNLLFPDEKMLDLLSSDSDSGGETEEEGPQPSKKRKLDNCTIGL